MAKGFGSDLFRQMQKVRLERDGTFRAPVRANGKDGIVVGDPPILDFTADQVRPVRRRGVVARLRAALRR